MTNGQNENFERCIFCGERTVPPMTIQQPQLEGQNAINITNRVCTQERCKKVNPTQVLSEEFRYKFKSDENPDGEGEEREETEIAKAFDENENIYFLKNEMKPRPCQVKALGPGLKGKNVLLVERAGQGKTLVYALPAIQKLDEIYSNEQQVKKNVML